MPDLRAFVTLPVAALGVLLSGSLPAAAQGVDQGPPNVPEFQPAFKNQTRAPAMRSAFGLSVASVADGLSHPWGIAILPSGGYLVSERSGTLRHVSANGGVSRPINGLPRIAVQSQGGLLDIKLGPTFSADRLVYWTYSKPVRGGSVTAAARGRLSDDLSSIEGAEDVFLQSPAVEQPGHYGSRIVFDGQHAFVTLGDRQVHADLAQDLASTTGSIARILLNGQITTDNPFASTDDAHPAIWSYGHRNIQGAFIHPQTGALWTIEHGPRGGDELNQIKKGANYGWPIISYGENYSGSPVGKGITARDGMEQPVYYWDPVIAPGDMTVYTGDLFDGWRGDILIGSLNPGGIVRLKMANGRVVGEERLLGNLGRVRDVAMDKGRHAPCPDRSAGRPDFAHSSGELSPNPFIGTRYVLSLHKPDRGM